MEPIYNIPMPTTSRVQSGLGRARKEATTNTNVNALLLAKVVKINYLYNTVDVVTTDKNESFTQTAETRGKYSARVPVSFGGSLTNGMSYGETSPINIGDTVLIGFINGVTSAPIVINVYKSDFVARDLAPTLADQSYVSGLPEDPENFDLLFSHLQVYPSQTYKRISGLGNIEHTFPGKVFFKTSTDFEANANIDDASFTYEALDGAIKRNGDYREPLEGSSPNILFQVPWAGITENVTNMFFSDGLFRLSNVFKNLDNNSHMYMDRTGNIGFKQLLKTYNPNDDTTLPEDTNEIGLVDGIPTLRKGKFLVELREEGFSINGRTLEAILEEYTSELQLIIDRLTKEVVAIQAIVNEIDLDALAKMVTDIQALQEDLEALITSYNSFVTTTNSSIRSFELFMQTQTRFNEVTTRDITVLNTEIIDSRGPFDNLSARLSSMNSTISQLQQTTSSLTTKVTTLTEGMTALQERTTTLEGQFTATQVATKINYSVSGSQVTVGIVTPTFPATIPAAISPLSEMVFVVPTIHKDGVLYGQAVIKVASRSIAILSIGEDYSVLPTSITYNK